ncbi:MAG: hypothetical protein JKY56_12280 [Kofleriaceae bacterium]|nr:hypothetical protein [Kofleriaceae bacterium]
MTQRRRTTMTLVLCALAACKVGDFSATRIDAGTAGDAGRVTPDTPLDKQAAQDRFVTTTDLMRYTIAPTCAAENNECHSNEDFPDLHTEGNFWNLLGLNCNLGVGERDTIEDYCEGVGDEIRVVSGANQGFSATIGSIEVVTDQDGAFTHYALTVQTAPSSGNQDGADFEFTRNGIAIAALGGGASLSIVAGDSILKVTDSQHIPLPSLVRQGDENHNGIYGTGEGTIIKAGDARGSYLVRRLLHEDTNRVRMPLGGLVDNPNEVNPYLSVNEMYVLMSWINCMQESDGVASPIRYDCVENATNEGKW